MFPLKYWRGVARVAMRDYRKIPSMFRLKTFKSPDVDKDFNAPYVRVHPPLIVSLRLNYSCNLRCIMCNQWGESGIFTKDPGRATKRTMSTDDWKQFIDRVAQFSPYITFIGGEPLLNEDLPELIAHASSRHLITSLTTNGTFLKKRGESLIRAGLDYIHLSLDAPEEAKSGAIRRRPNSEDSQGEASDAIREFISLRDRLGHGLPIVQVQTTIVSENHDKLLEMADFVERSLKPDLWSLQLCVFTTQRLNDGTSKAFRHHFSQEQVGWSGFIRSFAPMNYDVLDQSINQIKKKKKGVLTRIYRPMFEKGFSFKRYFEEPNRFSTDDPLRCMHPYVYAQAQPNGDLVFCGEQPDYVIGNIKDGDFMDAWCGERASKWRAYLQKTLFPSCKRCYALHELNRFSPTAR